MENQALYSSPIWDPFLENDTCAINCKETQWNGQPKKPTKPTTSREVLNLNIHNQWIVSPNHWPGFAAAEVSSLKEECVVASFQTPECLVPYSVTGQMLAPEDLLSLLSTACDRVLCVLKTLLSFQLHGQESPCLNYLSVLRDVCYGDLCYGCCIWEIPQKLPS